MAIAEALKINSALQKLSLSDQAIKAEGATALAEALQINSTLQELLFSDSYIPQELVCQIKSLLTKENRDERRLELATSNGQRSGT